LGGEKVARFRLAQMQFPRITARADQLGGIPCVRGLRVPVVTIVGMRAEGMSEREIADAYPDLEIEDVRESMRYAAAAVEERGLPLRRRQACDCP
jgi:uncharacterized protein (DUF433 family)